ncbi:MAG: siderophore ABC transporter substrate-binding protein [Candidatus Dactylopiibacterium sp.]|nr:siderophore ABC transporter substrate-binding protein [Candidatus Dactylopiibacterium sp.]
MSLLHRLIPTLLLAGFAAGISAAPLTIRHASGTTELKERPQKVLVYDLGALDTLDALGVKVAGVPAAHMPPALKRYEGKEFPKIGSLFDPDYEAVAAAAPDLIIVGSRARAKFAELSRIAPVIDVTPDAKDYLGSTERNARLLGQLFGKEAEVERRLRQLEVSSAALKARASKAGNALIVLTTGGKISAYGPGSRFGAIHDQFGMPPADTSLKPSTHGQAVSYEYILKINPDWLFVVDRDSAIGNQGRAAAQLLDNPVVARTRAWQSKHVIYLDPAAIYLTSGGLRSEQAIVDAVARAFAN